MLKKKIYFYINRYIKNFIYFPIKTYDFNLLLKNLQNNLL